MLELVESMSAFVSAGFGWVYSVNGTSSTSMPSSAAAFLNGSQ